MEILRDPIRLSFSLVGPVLVMLTMGYGISFDVEHLSFAAFDQDQSLEARELIEQFSGSRYFEEHPSIASDTELDRRLEDGELKVAIEIPPNFGKDLVSDKGPEISAWVDGADPFRAETTRSYLTGLTQTYLAEQVARGRTTAAPSLPVNMQTRFRYNQAFKSVYSIIPGIIMVLLMMIPAMMTALGVVREKETGSIANFRSTPITRLEFLLGKQLPYVVIALITFRPLNSHYFSLFFLDSTGEIFSASAGPFTELRSGWLCYFCGLAPCGASCSASTRSRFSRLTMPTIFPSRTTGTRLIR